MTRVKLPRAHEWKRDDRNGNHIATEKVIRKSLRKIKADKVTLDSALRDAPLSKLLKIY